MLVCTRKGNDVARRSRPPGFDMTYRPHESVFGPPLLVRLPSMLYLLSALGFAAFVAIGESSPSGSWAFQYVVAQDVRRFMSIRVFSTILMVSAMASIVRASMRGVRVYPDGVEVRDVLNLVVPKVRRYRWPQIECIILDGRHTIALDLWDGSRALLPRVGDRGLLEHTLEHVAAARAIPVRGGRGLDEVPEPEGEEE